MGQSCAEAISRNASRILIFSASPTVDVGNILTVNVVRFLSAGMLHLTWLTLRQVTFTFGSRRHVCYDVGESKCLLSLRNVLAASTIHSGNVGPRRSHYQSTVRSVLSPLGAGPLTWIFWPRFYVSLNMIRQPRSVFFFQNNRIFSVGDT